MADLARLLCSALTDHLGRSGRPRLPAGGELLWKWFVDLSASRAWGMAGPAPITLEAIDAYRRLTSWPIEERHVRILRAMDAAFRQHFRQPSDRTVSSRQMTAGLFDAIFGG